MIDKRTVNKKVLVIIPAYNEEGHIGKVIAGIPAKIIGGDREFKTQVVVVDDGSTDNTYNEAQQAKAIVLRHVINSGAGAATRTGLRFAELQSNGVAYVVTIDADGQHASQDIQKIVNFAEEHHAEMVVGNRLHGGNKGDIPLHRTFGNLGLGLIGRVLFGIKVRDTQSGLRLFRRDVLSKVSDYTIDRYGFCTEMLWHAVKNGVKVQEMPISVTYSSETLSRGQSNWGAIALILDLLWIRISE